VHQALHSSLVGFTTYSEIEPVRIAGSGPYVRVSFRDDELIHGRGEVEAAADLARAVALFLGARLELRHGERLQPAREVRSRERRAVDVTDRAVAARIPRARGHPHQVCSSVIVGEAPLTAPAPLLPAIVPSSRLTVVPGRRPPKSAATGCRR